MPSDAPTDVEPQELRFADDGVVPNNPRLPALLYRGVVAGEADAVIRLYGSNGWGGAWVWRVFDYHHYHPNAHEVLTCVGGSARLMLGGPHGSELEIRQGDAAALPAGTGHKLLSMTRGFQVCGAYPRGQEDYETRRGTPEARAGAIEAIARVPMPECDPFFGADGPLMRLWGETSAF